MRKGWKWIVLIAAVAVVGAVALWLGSGDTMAVATLHLSAPPLSTDKDQKPGRRFPRETDGIEDQLRFASPFCVEFEMRSDQVFELPLKYSIEAHTPAGQTNYDAPILGSMVRPPGIFTSHGEFPVTVAVPIDTDEFRVQIVVKEYGFFYSRFQAWVTRQSVNGSRFAPIARQWLSRMHPKSARATVWSPWVVRSNNAWMEKVER